MNGIEFAGFSERGDEPPQGKEFNSPVMSVNSIRRAESTGSKNVYYLFFLFNCRSCSLAKSCFHYLNRRVLCDFSLSFQEDRGGEGGGRYYFQISCDRFVSVLFSDFSSQLLYRWTLFVLFSRTSVVTYTENVYHH